MKKVLLTASVQSHISQFHKPLINMLKENGYEVHVAAKDNLAEKNGLKLDEPDKIFNIPFDRSPLSKNNLIAHQELKKILSKTKYDVVHCNTPMGGVVTRLAANKYRKSGTKVFYTAHGFHFYKGAPKKNWIIYYPIEKFLSRYTDKLITITKEDYNLSTKKFSTNVVYTHGVGANSDKYCILSNEEKLLLQKEHGYSKDQFNILCIGELNDNKNQKTVIRSFFEVTKKIPTARLLLAGNGPMENYLKKLVYELGIESKVHFLGYRTDLERYLCACDLVVSASIREGLPLNIMESILCGKPVIVSNNRGHRELINNNINGLINEAYDVEGFSKSIIRLFKNSDLRRDLVTNALSSIEKFTYESVVEELSKIYEINM